MERIQSLADYLGVEPTGARPNDADEPRLEDIRDAKAFAEAVLASQEFRSYIVNSLVLGSLPPAVTCRLMDYAWGKPPDRVEHTGKDGRPIETVTEVRRVVIRAAVERYDDLERQQPSTTRH